MKRCSESVSVSKLPLKAQLLWHRVLEHVDAWGVMVGDGPLVWALCVAATCGDEITVEDVEQALEQFEALGMVWRYEMEGAQYIATKKHEEYSWKVRRPAPLLPMTQEVADSRDFSKYRSAGTRWRGLPDKLKEWADRCHIVLPMEAEIAHESSDVRASGHGSERTANVPPLAVRRTASVQAPYSQRTDNVRTVYSQRTAEVQPACVDGDSDSAQVTTNERVEAECDDAAADVQPMYSQCTDGVQPTYSQRTGNGSLCSVVESSVCVEGCSVVGCTTQGTEERTKASRRPKDYRQKLQDARMGSGAINWLVVNKDELDAIGGEDVWLYATALDIISNHEEKWRAGEWIRRRSAGCMPGSEHIREARIAFGLDADEHQAASHATRYTCNSCGHVYTPKDGADIVCPNCNTYIAIERRVADEGGD